MQNKEPKVLVIMGSDSDFEIMKSCLLTLKKFKVDFDCEVCSAHRTPEHSAQLAKSASDKGYGCIIAAAGKAAHLAGVLAAFTILPVIGVPIKSDTLDGLDSLLSMVQMPSGIPVATVAINGADNAAILAVQILSGTYPSLKEQLIDFKNELESKVKAKNEMLQKKLETL